MRDGSGTAGALEALAPEFRLLCLAARQPQRPADAAVLRAMVAAGVDWQAVAKGARQHRVEPLVLAGLQACRAPETPPDVLAALRHGSIAATRQSLAQAAEVARLSRLFAAAGVRMMVLKGVVLSQQLYGNLSTRGAGDIDLLVDPADFWTADGVLAGAGYRPAGAPVSAARRTASQRMFKDLMYRHEADGHLVELHQRLTDNPHRLRTDFASLWRDREEVALGGATIATLPRSMLPLYLCVHGASHCWERLRWLADLTVLLKDADGVAAALALADAAGVGAAMRRAAILGHDWLDLPVPGPLLSMSPDRRRAARFAAHLFAGPGWLDGPPHGSVAWFVREMRRRGHRYTLKGGWRHALREFRVDLEYPIDWSLLPLPDRLLWLYPVLRPFGWVVRNARRWRSRR
ncbi:MAG TPA: nucleotidyltransferase family protein [Azospirillum sp.]